MEELFNTVNKRYINLSDLIVESFFSIISLTLEFLYSRIRFV